MPWSWHIYRLQQYIRKTESTCYVKLSKDDKSTATSFRLQGFRSRRDVERIHWRLLHLRVEIGAAHILARAALEAATSDSTVQSQITGDFESSHFPELTGGLPLLGEHKAEHDKIFNGLILRVLPAVLREMRPLSLPCTCRSPAALYRLFSPRHYTAFVLSVSKKQCTKRKNQRCRNVPQTDDVRGHAALGCPPVGPECPLIPAGYHADAFAPICCCRPPILPCLRTFLGMGDMPGWLRPSRSARKMCSQQIFVRRRRQVNDMLGAAVCTQSK